MPRRGRPGDQHLHRADARLRRRAVLDDARSTAAPCWPWAGAGAGPAPRSAAPPASGIGCRCRFPGCESRRVDLHHIQHWVNGGRTDLANLISLCPYHHKAGPRPRLPHRRPARRRRLRVLPPGRHPGPVQPAPARARRQYRGNPRRGHHPGDDHPALVRRAPRPGPRHLHLPGQRQDQGRTRAAPGWRPRQPGPRHHLRTRRLARTDPPVRGPDAQELRPGPGPDTGLSFDVVAPC